MTQTKIFAPDCWSGVSGSQHQIKVASTGLGRADAKAAEEFMSPETAHFFSKLSLHPDCFYVHKLAMGCSERYGPNRWGDGFSEKALRNDVGTFERHAKAYRQHQSKGPHYGSVKLARYRDSDGIVELITEYYGSAKVAATLGGEGAKEADEEIQELLKHGYFPVSMGSLVPFDVCFEADRLILTAAGYRRIADVRLGDIVLTHTAQWQPVTCTMRRKYCGEMVTLSAASLSGVRSTREHPYLVLTADSVRDASGRLRKYWRNAEPLWIPAVEVEVGDYLLYPVESTAECDNAERLQWAYLLGAFCGDGFRIRQRSGRKKNGDYKVMGLGFACDRRLLSVVERLELYLAKFAKNQPRRYSEQAKNYVALNVYDREFASKVLSLCGEAGNSKRIPDYLFTASKEEKLAFVAGMLDTDGSVDSKKGSARITGTNRGLLHGLHLLCLSAGLPAPFRSEWARSTYSEGELREVFWVNIACSELWQLAESVKAKGFDTRSPAPRALRYTHDGANYIAYPVRQRQVEVNSTVVYNISVADDESYVIEGIAVHNCSTCNHKAPKPKDRCMSKKEGGSCNMFGCLNGMLKMASSGQLQYVDNPHNTFYDISKVKTGADPIANGVLLPVGDFYRDLKSNSKVAEFAFDQIPNIEESPLSRSLFCLANKLAEMEAAHRRGDFSGYDFGFCKIASASYADTRDLDSVNHTVTATALSQALRNGSYISFERLCKHSGISEGQAQKYAMFLPDLYQRLRLTGKLPYAVAQAEKLAHLIENSARKFAAAKVASIDLKQINRASLLAAANEQSFETLKTAATHESLPEVVMKFAAIELCLTHHSPQSDLRAFGLVRRKNYSIPGGN